MTERLKMRSVDRVAQNIEKIGKLFPNAVTEVSRDGRLEKAIDFDVLRQELSGIVVEGGEERYQFTWPDKRKSILAANAAITATLRPCKEESVGRDGTPGGFDSENLYIEGDNLEVLKLLQETYLNKIKMIYIDPPYNTGNDFVYNDDFAEDAAEYAASSGQYDEVGNRLVSNTESNGRFHTDWLNMIYPRLKLARDLLTDDGVIFISIDDNEVQNLRKISDEIFGEKNFLAQVIWERAYAPINLMKHFSPSHDYLLCYAKNIEGTTCNGIKRSEEANERYTNPDNDPRGPWKPSDLSVGPAVEVNIYPITTPSGRIVQPPAGRSWSLSRKAFLERLQDHRIWFGPNGDSVPSMKRFLSELRKPGMTPMTIWKYAEVGHSQDATQKLAQLFDNKKFFDYPKPVGLIKRCLELYSEGDSTVMDFFSGSATTAHAVMQLNAEDGGKRKFIMVQIPEKCKEDSDAYRAGYPNICEIGKERIRRAGRKIKEEAPLTTTDLDTGFRVFKLDTSNMKDVYYAAGDYNQGMLEGLESNIKEDRTEMDLLFGCLLDWGLPLSLPYTSEVIDDCMVQTYNEGDLIACFADNVPESVVKVIARRKPLRAVFRDASFADSPSKINVGEIFKLLAPETSVKVI